MRVLIISDTHGRDRNLMRVLEKEKDIGLMVHLGDLCGLEDYIEDMTGIPCYMVRGNNDYGSLLPDESVIMLGKHRTFITHGHQLGVSYSTRDLKHYALDLDCDIAIYGHTHYPEIDDDGRIAIVNPGSLTYPRQPGSEPSYAIALVDENGDVSFELRYLK